ncbi:response regulator [Simiduia agarivorans]|uniref:histidine kinase n=1 Tax=Simiduia agarivorans (strain DSM 21679 / JCM 13881 / BCRC 17597 / SA1) TaxID=1117647 RepID=K4KK79_SIMAS|nr:response regulator [Simiduia agarivorans]AFU98630.1 PAS domain-containing protein [Simiduia agarivorans SA1 = DSM 21679]
MYERSSSPASLIVTLLALVLAGLLAAWQIQSSYNKQLESSLNLILNATQQALQRWRQTELQRVQFLARDPALTQLVTRLLQARDDEQKAQIRVLINQLLAGFNADASLRGYLIIDRSHRVLAANQPSMIGQSPAIAQQIQRMDNLWSGQPRLSRIMQRAPDEAPTPIGGSHTTMFSLATISAPSGQGVAIFAIELNLDTRFYPILSQARLGYSGETYVFDQAGVMLSESRFREQLREMGLIGDNQSAALNIQLHDPGQDLRQKQASLSGEKLPLTQMAQSAIKGISGFSATPYRDYRGIPVIGAWTWDQQLNLGIASELDAAEAFSGLKVSLYWLAGLTAMALMLIVLLFSLVRRHQINLARAHRESSAILNNAPAFILVRDLDNCLMFANREALEFFGVRNQHLYTATAIDRNVSKPHLSELLPARFQQFIEDKDDQILKEKIGFTYTANISFDNTQHNLLLTKFPLREADGKVYGIGLSGVDVTERMNTEAKLKEKELFQANLMASLPGAVYRCSLDYNGWHLVYISPGCLTLLGHNNQELTDQDGRLFNELIHPEDREMVQEKIRFAFQHNQPYEFEYRLNNNDVVIWLWARGRIIEQDGSLFTEGFLSDITERKLVERELAAHRRQLTSVVAERTRELDRERERLADIIRSAADGIISFDDHLHINLFSPSAVRILGLEHTNLTGLPVLKFFTDKSQIILKENIAKLNQKMKIKSAQELWIARKNGEVYRVEASLSRNATHGTENYTLILRDISLRLEQQQALKAAIKNAEEASLAKSQFLANISHEIRTPLNAIIGMSQLTLNTEQLRYLKTIEYSSHTLLGVINDVLDFSKIEAGKLQIESIPFNLEASLEAISQMTALRAQEKGVDFLLDIDIGVPSQLVGDPLRLSQILTNLCSNATKFTEQGHITLGTKLLSETEQTVTLEFFVEDTGIGLSAEQQAQLFKAFAQADPSVTRRYGGTGLGLSICRELVRLMGSEIRVTSEVGLGSRFSFSLTLQRDCQSTQKALRSTHSELSILLVEDNAATADLLMLALKKMGHRVTHCDGGEQALAHLSNHADYDVLLVDWQLPGIPGDALISQVKSRSDENTPVVVMITAFEETEAAPVACQAGADALLIKPISASTLFDTLDNLTSPIKPKPYSGFTPISPFRIPPTLRGASLLLVEDNEINQEIAREIFESAGFNVNVASNGQDAVDWFSQGHADLILMDVQMPVLDGESATRTIRATEKGQSVPIIAMTANAMKEDEQRCLAAGMNDYLTKPINIDKALATVCQWLERTGVQAAPASNSRKAAAKPGDGLPKMPGLDTQRGLINCSGNASLYIRLLQEFAEDYADVPRQIMQLLDEENWSEAHQKTHSLKGVSGNLGANLLYLATKELDNNIRQQNPDRNKLAGQAFSLNRTFQQLTTSIQRLSSPNG